jgi:hypothetical protein
MATQIHTKRLELEATAACRTGLGAGRTVTSGGFATTAGEVCGANEEDGTEPPELVGVGGAVCNEGWDTGTDEGGS